MSKLSTLGYFFAGMGALFAGFGGWFLWQESSFSERSIPTRGTIVKLVDYRDSDGDTMYRPVAEYFDARGRRYEFSSNTSSSSPGFRIGEEVDILYDPLKPHDARIDTWGQRFLLPVIFSGMGSLFVLIGLGLVVFPILRARTIARLMQSGLRTEGTIVRLYRDTSIAVNDQNPWRAIAEAKHPRTGELCEYKSDALWERPYSAKEGDIVPIFVSASNAKKSYVDIDNAIASDTPSDDGHWKFGQARSSFGKAAPRGDTPGKT